MLLQLEIVFTRAAPAFHNLFMGRVFNKKYRAQDRRKINVSSLLLKFTFM